MPAWVPWAKIVTTSMRVIRDLGMKPIQVNCCRLSCHMERRATARFLRTPGAWWSLSLRTGVVENGTLHDCIIVGLGHAPGSITDVKQELIDISMQVKQAKRSITCALQTCSKGPDYAEYFLVGLGSSYTGEGSRPPCVPAWIGPFGLNLEKHVRVSECDVVSDTKDLCEKAAEGSAISMCAACAHVKSRVLTELPRPPRLQQNASDNSEWWNSTDGDAPQLADVPMSDISEAGSADEGPTPRAPTRAASHTLRRLRPGRQGVSVEAWSKVLNVLAPCRVVLAGPFTFQAGLLLSVLQYNDARFGVSHPCKFVGFCLEVPPGDGKMGFAEIKRWQRAHLCLHTVLGAMHGYIFARCQKMRSNEGLCLNAGPALLPATQMGMSDVLPGLLVPEAPAKVTLTH